MEIIQSAQNPLIKGVKKLQQKKYREEKGEFLIEGIRLVEEAERAEQLEMFFYDESLWKTKRGCLLFHRLKQKTGRCHQVSSEVLKVLSETQTPQGIVAVAKKKELTLSALSGRPEGIVLISDGIQDPGNLGAMIRTAWAAGVGALIALTGTVDPYNSKTVRSTMGGIFHVPLLTQLTWQEVYEWIRRQGYQVVAGVLDGGEDYYRNDYTGKVALIIGNEGQGLQTVVLQDVDRKVKIPLAQGAESLNAAVACGILLYEIVKQQSKAL